MRTHLRHRTCGGEIIAERRQVISMPNELQWPKDLHVRVAFCETCRTVVDITECRDERLPEGTV